MTAILVFTLKFWAIITLSVYAVIGIAVHKKCYNDICNETRNMTDKERRRLARRRCLSQSIDVIFKQ